MSKFHEAFLHLRIMNRYIYQNQNKSDDENDKILMACGVSGCGSWL